MEVKVMEKMWGNYEMEVKEIRKDFPNAVVFDISKRGGMGYLSPESVWGNIEVPGMAGMKGLSVLGIWEGLKVFGRKGVDMSYICAEKRLGTVRNCKSYGKWIGVRFGDEILDVDDGIEKVFKDTYRKELKKRYGKVIDGMRKVAEERDIILIEEKEGNRKEPCSVGEILKDIIIGED